MGYRINKPIKDDAVPDWERKPPKWAELVDALMELEVGEALPVEFEDPKEADRARNAVRDLANLRAKAVVARTRVVLKEDGTATLYLIRVNPLSRE